MKATNPHPVVVQIYLLGRDAALSHYFNTRSQQFFPLSWLPLLLFLILRIVGASLQISTIGNPSPSTGIVGNATSFSMGLPLLLAAVIEVLDRVNVYASRGKFNAVAVIVLDRVLQAALFVSLVLFATAGARAGNTYRTSDGIVYPTTGILNRVAAIMTIVVFGVFVLGSGTLSLLALARGWVRERGLLVGVYIALPLLLVRLVYAILARLVGQRQANPVNGDLGLLIGLGFVMEILVVVFLLAGGLVNLGSRRERLRRVGPGSVTRSTSRRSGSRRSRSGTGSSSRGTRTTTTERSGDEVYVRRG